MKQIGDAWNERLACQVTKQLLEALSALHSKKIAHRNVTIYNIVVKSYSAQSIDVELAGFSQAIEILEPITEDSIYLDSYKAPEMTAAIPYDTQVDMWMLACCTFCM